MRIPRASLLFIPVLAAGIAAVPAAPASAKEESKIILSFEPTVPPAPNDPSGTVRGQLQEGIARLQVKAKDLEPGVEHVLMTDAGEEIARFVPGNNGKVNLNIDLFATGDATTPPVDPRGKVLIIDDGTGAILLVSYYGPEVDDPPRPQIKEWTDLEPGPLATTGSVSARYDKRPNEKDTFGVQTFGIPTGTYELWVGGVKVADFTTNPGGNAKVEFRSTSGNGNSGGKGKSSKNGNNVKAVLDFDPRLQLVEVRMGADVYFSGEMLAKIEGLNVCTPAETVVAMTPGVAQPAATGSVTLGVEDDCGRAFAVDVAGLLAGSYEIAVDGAVVGMLDVAVDGEATGVVFASDPVAPELPLDFSVTSGSVVEVRSAGSPVLSATLP
jgi:hypothetical protein